MASKLEVNTGLYKARKDLAYYTDCAIATYSYEGSLARTSKSSRERFRRIAAGMLASCACIGVDADTMSKLKSRYKEACDRLDGGI